MVLAGFAQIGGITSWLNDKLTWLSHSLFSYIITPICFILYSLQLGLFYLMDAIQGIFRSLAGLELYYYDGQQQSGDLVMSLIQSQEVMSVFWAVLVVAIMLLFVTTFVAIIRSEFTEKGANPKGPIIGRAIKAIFYFAAVPIISIMGIFIANVFLRSLDTATANGATSISGVVFSAAAYQGNRARQNIDYAREWAPRFGIDPNAATVQSQVAAAIDASFRRNLPTPGDLNLNKSYMQGYKTLYGDNIRSGTYSISNFGMVFYYYDLLLGYNYLIGFAGGLMVVSLLITMSFGVIQRIFELVILFVVAPPFIAFMPIDDGAKYKQWRGEFIKKVGAMYGPIIGLNLMFLVLTVLQSVNIFPNDNPMYAMFNSIVQLIFLCVGLVSVKEFSSLISSLAGTDDSLGKGEKVKGESMQMAGRIAGGGAAAAQMGWRATKAAANTASVGLRKAGGAVGSLGAEEGEKNWLGRRWEGGANRVDSVKTGLRRLPAHQHEGKYSQYLPKGYLVDEKGNVKRKGWRDRGKENDITGLLRVAGYDEALIDLMDDKTKKALAEDFTQHGSKNITGEDLSKGAVIARARTSQQNAQKVAARESSRNRLGGVIDDVLQYTEGEGYKNPTGKIWDRFMGSLGKDAQRYGTFRGVQEAYEKGESGIGAAPIWKGRYGDAYQDIAAQADRNKYLKETKDARETQEAQAEAIVKAGKVKDEAMAGKLDEILKALQGGINVNNTGSSGSGGGGGGRTIPNIPTVHTGILQNRLDALARQVHNLESALSRTVSSVDGVARSLNDLAQKWGGKKGS